MSSQPRRAASRKLTRRERRTQGVARTYNVQTGDSTTVRRSYMAEPQALDYAAEARWIRKDLLRLVVWATLLIVAMIAISFLPLPIG
jgi:hypothetical protein